MSNKTTSRRCLLTATKNLPTIPTDKIYFSIREVAQFCQVKQHVLRYWEQEFQALAPQKSRSNRRSYTRDDVLFVRQIRYLLYEQGFTISGARKHLKQTSWSGNILVNKYHHIMQGLLSELEGMLIDLESNT